MCGITLIINYFLADNLIFICFDNFIEFIRAR